MPAFPDLFFAEPEDGYTDDVAGLETRNTVARRMECWFNRCAKFYHGGPTTMQLFLDCVE